MRRSFRLIPIAIGLFATPALAQEQVPDNVFEGDFLTIGAGIAFGPSYEGSDEESIFPIGALQGRVGGIGIQPRPAGIALDLVPDAEDARVNFGLGPALRIRTSRTDAGDVKDPIVALLPERDLAVEVGPMASIGISRVLNPFDSLTLSTDVRWDVAGAHGGMVISPGITYFTPLSRGAAVALSISGEYADGDYHDYYFSVSPADSAASGLAVYDADGGWKDVGLGLFGTYDLDGNLLNGGLAVFSVNSVSRLVGDAARSPLVEQRGSRTQWLTSIGLAYTF